MKLDELKALAQHIADDRKRVLDSPEKWAFANTNLVAQWSHSLSPEVVLALIACVEAADNIGCDACKGNPSTYDRARAALEKP